MTLDLPDQLAAEIEPMRDGLPMLLAITRQLFRPVSDARAHSSPVYLAYKQLLDLLANSPTPDAINRFTISAQAQSRVHTLLDKHGEGEIDQEEQAELRVYAQIIDASIACCRLPQRRFSIMSITFCHYDTVE